jgi:hypothetical protein
MFASDEYRIKKLMSSLYLKDMHQFCCNIRAIVGVFRSIGRNQINLLTLRNRGREESQSGPAK